MIKKTFPNQPSGRDREYLTGAFLKSFSIYIFWIVSMNLMCIMRSEDHIERIVCDFFFCYFALS